MIKKINIFLFVITTITSFNMWAISIVNTSSVNLDVYSSGIFGFQIENLPYNNYEYNNSQYTKFNIGTFYKNKLSNGLSSILNISYEYDANSLINNYNFNSFYVGLNHFTYGRILYGKTQSIYYNGFLGGWVDNGLSGGNEVALPYDENYDILGVKDPSNTLYYTNKFYNLKLALQVSGHSGESNMLIDSISRKSGYGGSIVYAIGPMYLGLSYLQSNIQNGINNYSVKIYSYASMIDIGGMYNAFSISHEENRDFLNSKAIGLTYLLKYDLNGDSKGFVPQLIYGYKKYTNGSYNRLNMINDNYLYTSLLYYINSSFNLFLDIKWDLRKSLDINLNDKYNNRENKITLGTKININ